MSAATQNKRVWRALIWALASCLFLVCLAYMVYRFQWRAAWQVLRETDIPFFLLSTGILCMVYWYVRTMRWRLLLKASNIVIPMPHLYYAVAVSCAVSIFTPLHSGELVKVEILKRRGQLGRMPGYATMLVERIADFSVIMGLAFVSLMGLGLLSWWALLYVVVGGCVVWVFIRGTGRIAGCMVRRGWWAEFLRSMKQAVPDFSVLFGVLAHTLFGWLVVVAIWKSVAVSISLSTGWIFSLAWMSLATMAGLASGIPGGVGVVEVATALLLDRMGFTAPEAQAVALLLRVLTVWMAVLGALHWMGLRVFDNRSAASLFPRVDHE